MHPSELRVMPGRILAQVPAAHLDLHEKISNIEPEAKFNVRASTTPSAWDMSLHPECGPRTIGCQTAVLAYVSKSIRRGSQRGLL